MTAPKGGGWPARLKPSFCCGEWNGQSCYTVQLPRHRAFSSAPCVNVYRSSPNGSALTNTVTNPARTESWDPCHATQIRGRQIPCRQEKGSHSYQSGFRRNRILYQTRLRRTIGQQTRETSTWAFHAKIHLRMEIRERPCRSNRLLSCPLSNNGLQKAETASMEGRTVRER